MNKKDLMNLWKFRIAVNAIEESLYREVLGEMFKLYPGISFNIISKSIIPEHSFADELDQEDAHIEMMLEGDDGVTYNVIKYIYHPDNKEIPDNKLFITTGCSLTGYKINVSNYPYVGLEPEYE